MEIPPKEMKERKFSDDLPNAIEVSYLTLPQLRNMSFDLGWILLNFDDRRVMSTSSHEASDAFFLFLKVFLQLPACLSICFSCNFQFT